MAQPVKNFAQVLCILQDLLFLVLAVAENILKLVFTLQIEPVISSLKCGTS